jgi:hypothetical protein
MKQPFVILTMLLTAAKIFSQQPNLELHVGDKIFTQDTVVDAVPNCSLKINCRIINQSIPADSLKLFYGVNAPNDIISFPENGGSFFYVPQMSDTAQQVILDFRLYYGDAPISRLQLSINVLHASKIAALPRKLATRSAGSGQNSSFDLTGRMINRVTFHAGSQVYVLRAADRAQTVVNRVVR